eukprot:COSAG02_NODE_296_length_25401_cov_7.672437_14_plen_173_part_00
MKSETTLTAKEAIDAYAQVFKDFCCDKKELEPTYYSTDMACKDPYLSDVRKKFEMEKAFDLGDAITKMNEAFPDETARDDKISAIMTDVLKTEIPKDRRTTKHGITALNHQHGKRSPVKLTGHGATAVDTDPAIEGHLTGIKKVMLDVHENPDKYKDCRRGRVTRCRSLSNF